MTKPRKGMLMNETKDEGEASKIMRKAGRPSLSFSHQTSDGLTSRSNSKPYPKESCIICQVMVAVSVKWYLRQLENTCLRCQRKFMKKDSSGG